jgi:hypothetical protein
VAGHPPENCPPTNNERVKVTNSDLTLLAGLLDRSGSMTTSKAATEEGWRGLIAEQAKQPGRCLVTLAQFDSEYNMLYSNLPIHQLPEFVLQPRWSTALLDAMGKFITDVGEHLSNIPEDDRPGIVICLIMTDGAENASKEWTLEGVKKLVEQQQDQWGWKFIFMGANMDAVSVAGSMGIGRDSSITFDATDHASNVSTYASAGAAISNTRSGLVADFTDDDRAKAMGKKK